MYLTTCRKRVQLKTGNAVFSEETQANNFG